uniref:cholesteryl ester transfer protein n=1 Tax=Doryrhamphus excisus TaxID=161450 RepID=UPI0025AE4216|nr:cholesteryl ester transfer protein [Doryrhamphus excisus]
MTAGRLPPWILLVLSLLGTRDACLPDPDSPYASTGAVCRLTYPAAVVLNEKSSKVLEAAFRHARYPGMRAEKSVLFLGTVSYGLDNLEIHNLTIGRSSFELMAGEGIAMEISDVSAVFNGIIRYGYGSWLTSINQSIHFDMEAQIDLGIKPKLYCSRKGKVAADTSSCYLNFDTLRLHLQGDKQPNWLKKLFTDFMTLTVKLVIKAQICKEINKVANILADFIQERAEEFLSDGDISVDVGVTAAPVITHNYIESYHKGWMKYKNTSTLVQHSTFHPGQLTDHRMLYFWISDQVLRSMVAAAHQDGRFQLDITGTDLTDLFKTKFSSRVPEFMTKCLSEGSSPELHARTSSPPHISTSTSGTAVRAEVSVRLRCGARDTLVFQTDISTNITASYADKHLFLHSNPSQLLIPHAELHQNPLVDEAQLEFIKEAVMKVGIPKVLSVLERELTRLLDKQGANLFDISNPEVLPGHGFVLIQMDFGFPHHLLVDFLKRSLQ